MKKKKVFVLADNDDIEACKSAYENSQICKVDFSPVQKTFRKGVGGLISPLRGRMRVQIN